MIPLASGRTHRAFRPAMSPRERRKHRSSTRPARRAFVIMILAVAGAARLAGQTTSGNLYVRVIDEQAGVLPGVGVTLSGCGAPMTTTTGTQGDFRFLNLAPCIYSLRTELSGFATVERDN